MSSIKKLIFISCLISVLYAQDADVYADVEKKSYTQPGVQRLTVSHVEGINAYTGFGTNFSSATLFLSPNYKVGRPMPFLDLRLHRFDNQTYGGNVGIGGRHIPISNEHCWLLGLNAYYDFRKGYRWYFSQLGVGAELLGRRLDFRGNLYIPLGTSLYSKCCEYRDFEGDWFAIHCRCESISFGFNGEVGYLILPTNPFFIYGAGGIYYFANRCIDSMLGWEVRVRPQYKDLFAIDFKASYDNIYHMVYQTTFILSIPLYQIANQNRGRPCGMTDRQIYQPVIRLSAMPIGRKSCWRTNFPP